MSSTHTSWEETTFFPEPTFTQNIIQLFLPTGDFGWTQERNRRKGELASSLTTGAQGGKGAGMPTFPRPWKSAPLSAPLDGCQAPKESGLETPHRTTGSGTPLSHRACSLKIQELTGSPGQGPRLHPCQGLARCRASGHGHGSQAQGSGAREPRERPGDDATFGL